MLKIHGLKLPMIADKIVTGNVFFVDSGGTKTLDDPGYGKNPDKTFATLDYAIGKCTASNGDIIVVLPGHAETTTAIALDVAGVSIVGAGVGRNRPAFTATTAASDLVDVTAANCYIENIRFVGAASGVTALIDIAAADFQAKNCVFEHGATPVMAVTVGATGDRFNFENCMWLGTANGPDCAIDLEASGIDDFIVTNCLFNYGRYGCDLGCIRANVDTCEGGWIHGCTFIGMETAAIDFNSSSLANCAGLVTDCNVGMAADTANIDAAVDAGSYGLVNCHVTDNPDASGSRIPVVTPA